PGCGSLEIVDEHTDTSGAEDGLNHRLDLGPLAAGEAAANPRHVNGCRQFERLVADFPQALPECFVADEWAVLPRPRAALCKEIRDAEIGLDLDELDGAECKVVRLALPRPASELLFGLLPALRDGDDKTFFPVPRVVADVAEDLVAGPLRPGRIALEVGDIGQGTISTDLGARP